MMVNVMNNAYIYSTLEHFIKSFTIISGQAYLEPDHLLWYQRGRR